MGTCNDEHTAPWTWHLADCHRCTIVSDDPQSPKFICPDDDSRGTVWNVSRTIKLHGVTFQKTLTFMQLIFTCTGLSRYPSSRPTTARSQHADCTPRHATVLHISATQTNWLRSVIGFPGQQFLTAAWRLSAVGRSASWWWIYEICSGATVGGGGGPEAGSSSSRHVTFCGTHTTALRINARDRDSATKGCGTQPLKTREE